MIPSVATGIVIDATVVRGLLTPALITLLGRSTWWFPDALSGTGPRGRRRQESATPGI
ncbi:MMPL family transporter [Streptomyces sp. 5.8]|uniref:MMPL family transporter n=1 Tax=Streptomyces sp. 5.8 TaxID=3406571 RepID=UPI003BB75842